jgi:hypothetical protein
MVYEYNRFSCEDQVNSVEANDGVWVPASKAEELLNSLEYAKSVIDCELGVYSIESSIIQDAIDKANEE